MFLSNIKINFCAFIPLQVNLKCKLIFGISINLCFTFLFAANGFKARFDILYWCTI